MNDPHVSRLRYRAIPASFIDLVDGPQIEVETDAFRAKLTGRQLVLEMTAHFASEAEARCIADPFVNGWAIASGLRRGRSEISFKFVGAQIIDRSATSGGAHQSSASFQLPAIQLEATLMNGRIRTGFPPAAPGFLASQEVEVLWARHQAFIDGREPLLSMAYFCLTFVQMLAGGSRERAAKKYRICRKVLDRIGELTSTHGDYRSARKVVGDKSPKTLTQNDIPWLEAAVRVMIWRVGASPVPDDPVVTVDEVVGFQPFSHSTDDIRD
jgi:hypothetical protein